MSFTYIFTLIIQSYCSIVPFEMSDIADYTYKLMDPELVITFSIRMDCYFGATFTSTFSNGKALNNFITFENYFLKYKIYSADIGDEGTYDITVNAVYGGFTDTQTFTLIVDATGWNRYAPIL